jgi:hypothetical protein
MQFLMIFENWGKLNSGSSSLGFYAFGLGEFRLMGAAERSTTKKSLFTKIYGVTCQKSLKFDVEIITAFID